VTNLEIVCAVPSMPSSKKLHSQGLGRQGTYEYIQILMTVYKAFSKYQLSAQFF